MCIVYIVHTFAYSPTAPARKSPEREHRLARAPACVLFPGAPPGHVRASGLFANAWARSSQPTPRRRRRTTRAATMYGFVYPIYRVSRELYPRGLVNGTHSSAMC